MISKTIGFRGLAYFQTHPYRDVYYSHDGSMVLVYKNLQNWIIYRANVGKYSIHGSYGIINIHVHMSCGPYLLHNAIDGVFLPRSPVP